MVRFSNIPHFIHGIGFKTVSLFVVAYLLIWHLGSTILFLLLNLVQNALAVKINVSTNLYPIKIQGQPDVS